MENLELNTKQLEGMTFFIVCFFIVGVILWDEFYRTDNRFYNNLLDSIKKEEYSGIVIDKYSDKENHNDPTLLLKSGEKVSVYGIIWGEINLGDSIVKNKGETTLKIYCRGGKTIVFDNNDIISNIRKSKEKKK